MIKVMLIGAAFSADLHSDAYARMRDKVKIAAIVDKNLDRVRDLANRYGFTDYVAYDDYEKAMAAETVDLCDICLPNFLHHDCAIAAMKAGNDIICEKPLATTVEDAYDMVRTANELGRHIYYAEDWLGSPALNKALAVIEEGAIGEVKFMRARECHCGSHSPFAQTIKFCGGGCMVHLGIHPVAFLLALKKGEWASLTAMTSGGGEGNLIHRTMEGEDWAGALMRFKDGTVAELEANYVTSGGMEDYIDFYGTKGCLHVDLTFSSPLHLFSIDGAGYTVEKAEVTTGWSRPAVDEKYNLGYVAEISHFVDCAEKKVDAKVGLRGADGYEALKVINLIYESAKTGKHIYNEA